MRSIHFLSSLIVLIAFSESARSQESVLALFEDPHNPLENQILDVLSSVKNVYIIGSDMLEEENLRRRKGVGTIGHIVSEIDEQTGEVLFQICGTEEIIEISNDDLDQTSQECAEVPYEPAVPWDRASRWIIQDGSIAALSQEVATDAIDCSELSLPFATALSGGEGWASGTVISSEQSENGLVMVDPPGEESQEWNPTDSCPTNMTFELFFAGDGMNHYGSVGLVFGETDL